MVCEPRPAARTPLDQLGITTTDDPAEALASLTDAPGEGFVLLAIKPQSLTDAAEQLRDHIPPSCAVISILAGTPLDRLELALGRSAVGGIVRAMPNTAVALCMGVTAVATGPGVSRAQAAFARDLFAALGEVCPIHESLMDAFTAVAGSGPAYVYYLAEAMIEAGVQMGFDPATSDRAVRATLRGAAAMMAGTATPAELRAAVTSKGGTTEAAVAVLVERGVLTALVEAITRGRDRAKELAG